jgi:DNA-binding MarR family transcriptional regulator
LRDRRGVTVTVTESGRHVIDAFLAAIVDTAPDIGELFATIREMARETI